MRAPLLARRTLLLTTFAACGGDAPVVRDTAAGAPRESASTNAPDVTVVPRTAGTSLGDTAIVRAAPPPPRDTTPGRRTPPPSPAASAAPVAPEDTARGDSTPAVDAPPEPRPAAPGTTPDARPPTPYQVGERLAYDVRFGPIRLGRATMELRALTEVRGEPAYHAVFAVTGGNALYRVNDHYESWFSARTGASLRYEQQIDQGSYERRRRFEIFPERRTYREEGKPGEEPSVAAPLDEASFLYFLRTVPLEVGRTYSFDRYFRPDRNPVTVRVLRREAVTVPAGTFDALVVQPTIKTPGIFSEGGRAEVWFADDSTRRILQIRSRLKFGTISLHLR